MLGDAAVAEPLEAERRPHPHETVIPLEECFEETAVARAELARQRAFEPREERAAAGRSPEKHERVVRDAHERRGENRGERFVVVPVDEQTQVHGEIADLLLAEIAAAGGAMRRETFSPERLLVPLGVR